MTTIYVSHDDGLEQTAVTIDEGYQTSRVTVDSMLSVHDVMQALDMVFPDAVYVAVEDSVVRE
jgi:hypothetical protein